MGEPFQFLADPSVSVPAIVVVSRQGRAVETGSIIAAPCSEYRSLWQTKFHKRPAPTTPIIVQNCLLIVIMQRKPPFQAGFRVFTQKVIHIGGEPFRSPVQVFERLGFGNEVLVIVADRNDYFI